MLFAKNREIYLMDTAGVIEYEGTMLQKEFPEYSKKLDKMCAIEKNYNKRAKE